jgi:hypothetical protein
MFLFIFVSNEDEQFDFFFKNINYTIHYNQNFLNLINLLNLPAGVELVSCPQILLIYTDNTMTF